MTVAPIVARAAATRGGTAVAARQGAGKVIDVTPVKSRPLNARPRSGRVSDAAAGAGAGKLLDSLPGKRKDGKTSSGGSARTLLVAEFALCMVVLAFSPLTDKHKAERPASFVKRASATMGVFFVLALIATAGRGASRAAAGFGGLVALVLLISQRSIFTTLTTKLGPGVGEVDDAAEGWDGIGEALADIADEVAEQQGNTVIPLPPSGPLGNGIR